MTLTESVAKSIIKKLINGQDYRIEIVTLINAEFLQYAIDFFKKIINAKLKSHDITVDWYKQEFLNPNLPAKEIAINSGLNKKLYIICSILQRKKSLLMLLMKIMIRYLKPLRIWLILRRI